ncbi:MAG TPA: hypothetical protein VNO30_22130 [Kofleriaceae bacterium]|nr:hypothetical protein [Kofleriaceae bacterium]
MTEPVRPTKRLARAALTTLAALAIAAPAHGQAPATPRAITPPAGWTPQPVKLAPPRPDVTSTTVETYFPPAGAAPGAPRPAALYVTRIERKAAPDRRDAIASGEIEEIFAAQRRQGAGASTEASVRRADPAQKQLEATLTWRDASAGVVDTSRVVVAADAQRVVAVTGQCLLGAGAAAELAKACEAALATLDPGIPAAARAPLALAAEPAPVEAPAPATATAPAATATTGAPTAGIGPAPAGSAKDPAPARLDDASHISLPPRPAQAQEPDRRPLYLGFGLVVIALLFWWNRRRRDRFDEDRASGEPRAAGTDTDDDTDDDDLHAAADEPPPAPPGDKEKDE